jgi:hypothetical protein
MQIVASAGYRKTTVNVRVSLKKTVLNNKINSREAENQAGI